MEDDDEGDGWRGGGRGEAEGVWSRARRGGTARRGGRACGLGAGGNAKRTSQGRRPSRWRPLEWGRGKKDRRRGDSSAACEGDAEERRWPVGPAQEG